MKAIELKLVKLPAADREEILNLIEENFNIPHDKAATFIAYIKNKCPNTLIYDPKKVIWISDSGIEGPRKVLNRLLSQTKPEKRKNTKVGNPAAFKRNEFIELTIQKCSKFLEENGFNGKPADILFFTALVMVHIGFSESPKDYDGGIDVWKQRFVNNLYQYANFLQNSFDKKINKDQITEN